MRFKHYLFSVFILSLLPLISIFSSQDLFHTHDGLVHLPRIGAYFKALTDGQLPIRWAGDLNYGYGMPLFNFIYQLPYAIASVFLLLGFGLVNTFKITLALSYILSGIFMFLFGKAFFNDDKKAFLVAIFYQFVPFRLVELLIRGSFGEVYTYTLLPLALLGLTLIIKKQSLSHVILTAIASALLILSHNSVSLLFFGICILFVLIFSKTKKAIAVSFIALLWGIAMSSFYWMPALLEHKYTYGDLFMKNVYLSHFPPFQNLFIPNLINSTVLQTEGIPVQIGLFHVIGLLLSIVYIIRKRVDSKTQKLFIFCLLLSVFSFLFIHPISKTFWEHISLLRQFQFPWRFLSVTSFTSALLAANFLHFKIFNKKNFFVTLVILTILSTIYYWKPQLGYDKIDEGYYWSFPLNTTYYGETDLIWSSGPANSYPKERVEIIGGEGTIKNFKRKSNKHNFLLHAKTDVQLVSHTQYFPGWEVLIDGKGTPIQFQDPNWKGEITFFVSQGMHQIHIVFAETKMRRITDIISLATFIILIFSSLFAFYFKRKVRVI